jgi:translation initiation factor 2 alpha subunit (eIF-2alpha)
MDVEKTIEFILEQQAAQAAGLTQLGGFVVEVATAQERTNAIVAALAERQMELVESQQELLASQKGLVERFGELLTSQKELAASQKELAERQKVTEQSLNALISMVERHLADHK